MPPVTLKKLLQKDSLRILDAICQTSSGPIGIFDVDHQLLYGAEDTNGDLTKAAPIVVNGKSEGWVSGQHNPRERLGIAKLLAYMLTQEAEKKDLAAEVLERYRELNLVYRLSSRLMTSPQPELIAGMALDEICPLIHAMHGAVLLCTGNDGETIVLASCGLPYHPQSAGMDPGIIVRRVIETGVAEMVNSQPMGGHFPGGENETVSILAAPLMTDKGTIGAITVVGHRPDQFTAGDLKLLKAIAMQTAPAIEIARLYQVSLENARFERDLQLARKVQADLLPKKEPNMPGWRLSAYWQPARMVSGDFYDFIHMADGRLGIIVGDVTDKGMPAALVMANTRSILRAVIASSARKGQDSPGKLLARANNLLCDDMPLHMFVTCMLVVLDPQTGHVTFANAGHPLPILKGNHEPYELHATGIPLGIFKQQQYDEKEAELARGESLFMYSDGLTEAHNSTGDMFGVARVRSLLAGQASEADSTGDGLVQLMLGQLEQYLGPGSEQEDDVTMVVLERLSES